MSAKTRGLSWLPPVAQALIREHRRTVEAVVLSPLLSDIDARRQVEADAADASRDLCHYITGLLDQIQALKTRQRRSHVHDTEAEV